MSILTRYRHVKSMPQDTIYNAMKGQPSGIIEYRCLDLSSSKFEEVKHGRINVKASTFLVILDIGEEKQEFGFTLEAMYLGEHTNYTFYRDRSGEEPLDIKFKEIEQDSQSFAESPISIETESILELQDGEENAIPDLSQSIKIIRFPEFKHYKDNYEKLSIEFNNISRGKQEFESVEKIVVNTVEPQIEIECDIQEIPSLYTLEEIPTLSIISDGCEPKEEEEEIVFE